MKRFALAFFVIALVLSNLAAEAASATFATRNGEIFQLLLNGRLLNGRGTNKVILDRLPAGPHNVEFRIPARRGILTYCTKVFLERGFETNYILTTPNRNPNFFLREVGRRPLYPPTPVACHTCPPAYRPHGHGIYDDYDGYGNNGGGYQNGPSHPGQNYNQGKYNNGPGNGNNFNNQPNNVMSNYDADLLVESMRRKSFDDAKADLAEQALSNQLIMAEDVKKIMEQFSFESYRVDFAKFVYPKVYDQQNFYRVYDAFDFDSSINEMKI